MKTYCWVVSYDIADPKRLRNVAKIMETFGKRVQKSVFECWLTDSDHQRLNDVLAPALKAPKDSVRFYPLCADCRQKACDSGNTEIMEIKKFYIV